MDPKSRHRLVAVYLEYLAAIRPPAVVPTSKAELDTLTAEMADRSIPYDDLVDEMDECIRNEPDEAWSILLELVQRCEHRDLSMLGTGPLETFLFDYAAEYLDEFAQQIRTNPRFLEAMRYVNIGGIPAEVWRYLDSAMQDMQDSPSR